MLLDQAKSTEKSEIDSYFLWESSVPSIRRLLRGAGLPPFDTKRWRQKCPQGTSVGIGRRFSLSGHKRLRCFARPLRALAPLPSLLPLFSQCDPAGRRPAKIQFRKIRSSAAAEERKPAAAHAEGGIAPPAASGTSSAGRGLTKGDRTLAAPRIFRLGKKQINLHCFRLFVSLACRRYFRSAMFE